MSKTALLFLGLLVYLLPANVYAASVNLSPRPVNPFGITLADVSGTVIPVISMSMASIGECADQPNPSSVLGFMCNNGSGNDTIYFNVQGFEKQQNIYVFQVTTYSNATGTHVLVLRFVGIQPEIVAGTSIASKSYDSSNKWETVTFLAGKTDPGFLVQYTGVASGIDNAIVLGTAFLIILVIVIFVGFILMALDWTRRSVAPEKGEIKKIE